MPTPLRAGLVLLLVASPALAQSVSLAFGGLNNVTSLPFSQAQCLNNESYTVNWTSQNLASGNACSNMQIFVTNSGSCPPTPNPTGSDGGTADVVIQTVSISDLSTGSGTVPAQRGRDMPGLGGNCPDGVDIVNSICASVQYRASGSTNCDSALTSSTNLTLHYDAKPPVPPSMNLLPQDAKIVVQLGAQGEDLLRYEIQYAEAPATDAGANWRQAANLEASKTSESITGLTNGRPYLVRSRSIDVVENPSDYTDPQSATPQASNGFWGEYKDAGGHDMGCSTGGAAVPSVLGALAVLAGLLRRRR